MVTGRAVSLARSLPRLRAGALLCGAGLLAACSGGDPPAGGLQAEARALARCRSFALQHLPPRGANVMTAPGLYAQNGVMCRPDPVFGAACAPRPDVAPTAWESDGARHALVAACLRKAGLPAPVY